MICLSKSLIRLAYYPSLAYNRAMCALGIWNHWDLIDPMILLGAVPSRADLRTLHGMGVRSIVNLCEEFAGHIEEMASLGMTQCHLPTLDYHCPPEDVLIRGVRFLGQETAAGRKTYVHCKAGQGRSATLVLCHLMASSEISAMDAYAKLKSIRWHISRRLDRRAPVLAVERRLRSGSLYVDKVGADR